MHNPNIVVYIGHDVGRFIEPYGIETVHTPNLNRLAEEGVVFDNHFATAPQCSPSRASMFTGRCPHSTGVLGLTGGPFGWTLNEDEQHLARLLGAAGYETALIGIAHEALGGNCPDEQVKICGFDDASRHGQKDARRAGGALADWLSTREQPDSPFFVEIGTRAIHHAHQFEPESQTWSDWEEVDTATATSLEELLLIIANRAADLGSTSSLSPSELAALIRTFAR